MEGPSGSTSQPFSSSSPGSGALFCRHASWDFLMQMLSMLLTKLSSICALGAVSVPVLDLLLHCTHGSAATLFIWWRLVQGMDVSYVIKTLGIFVSESDQTISALSNRNREHVAPIHGSCTLKSWKRSNTLWVNDRRINPYLDAHTDIEPRLCIVRIPCALMSRSGELYTDTIA